MAKFQLSGIGIVGLSGKIGGTVFSKNGVARIRSVPTNPQTSYQLAQRAVISLLSAGWAGITPAQKQSWVDAAASGSWDSSNVLGLRKNPTGHQLYVRINALIQNAGGTKISSAPVKSSMIENSLVSLALDFDLQTVTVTVSNAALATIPVIVRLTPALSTGVMRPPSSSFRFVQAFTSLAVFDCSAAYIARFGPLLDGTQVAADVWMVNTLSGQTLHVGTALATSSAA